MATQRLTNEIKDQIIDRMVAVIMTPKIEQQQREYRAYAVATLNDAMGEFNQTFVEQLPVAYFCSYSLSIAVPGERGYTEYEHVDTVPDGIRIPHCFQRLTSNDIDGQAIKGAQQHRRKRLQLESESQELRKTARLTLNQFTTVKQLIDGWPDVVNYMPEVLQMIERNMPARRLEALDDLIAKLKG